MTGVTRLLAALLMLALLADASACTTAPLVAERGDGVLRMSQLCHCGCHARTGAPAGIGLTQVAALPAETPVPLGPRAEIERAPAPLPPETPPRAVDHVPISLA